MQISAASGRFCFTFRARRPPIWSWRSGKTEMPTCSTARTWAAPDVAPLAILKVGGTIITAAVAYTTPTGSYVVFKGAGMGCPNMTTGAFTAIKVSAASPPAAVDRVVRGRGRDSPRRRSA